MSLTKNNFLFTHADDGNESEEKTLEQKKTIETKCEAVGREWTANRLEDKCKTMHKNRREHYVVFHERN